MLNVWGSSFAASYSGPFLYLWGPGGYGKLGLNSSVNKSSPTQLGTSTNWSNIAGGHDYSAVIKTDGTMWLWGLNSYSVYGGMQGDNTIVNKSSPVQLGALTNWSQVAVGADYHVLSLKTDGTMWAWGYGGFGALGDNTTSINRSSPVQIGSLTTWSKVAASYRHSMAIKTDGTLWTWGNNSWGQLGGTTAQLASSSPVQVGALTTWSKTAGGQYHALAIKTDGTLWSWGRGDSFGQLGDNANISRSSPVQVGSLTTWSDIASGLGQSLAVKTDGTLWGWGRNAIGEVGDGTFLYRSSPVQVGSLTTWSKVACGSYHSIALKTDGTLWLWGNADYGRLGNNSTISRSSPIQVGTLTTWTKIAGGNSHSMGIG